MSDRKLTILAIVAVVMVVWAFFQSRISNRSSTAVGVGGNLIQGLDPEDIGSIIVGTGDDALKFERKEWGFVVTNKDNYPASVKRINELIVSCLDVKKSEFYTNNPANHKDLGVTEEDADEVVKFYRSDGSLLAGIIVGKAREQGGGTFVRLVGRDEVYVAPERPSVNTWVMSYIERDILDLNRNDIEMVTVSGPNDVYTVKWSDDGNNVVLENLPEGKKLRKSEAEDVLTALTSLSFSDVQAESSAEDLKFDRKYVCRTKDGIVYTLEIARKGDDTFIKCRADYAGTVPAVTAVEQQQSQQMLAAQVKAGRFLAAHSGWIYQIYSYKADDLTKELSELLEDVEKPKAAEQPAEESQAGDANDPNVSAGQS